MTVNGDAALIRFTGALDEGFELNGTLLAPYKSITLDLAAIGRVTSKGIREWILWVSRLDTSKSYKIIQCPRIFVTQANLVQGMIPDWMTVHSVEVPFYCENCEHSFSHIFEVKPNQDASSMVTEHVCDKCRQVAELDAIPERYFAFMKRKSEGK